MLERFAQWVRPMLGKPEGLSSNSQSSSTSGYGRCSCHSLSRWRGRQKTPQKLTGQLGWTYKAVTNNNSKETLSQKRWKMRVDFQGCSLIHPAHNHTHKIKVIYMSNAKIIGILQAINHKNTAKQIIFIMSLIGSEV